MKILLIALCFFLPQQEEVNKLKEKANTSLNNAEVKVLKINPDDNPVVKKCPCNGKGYIVHGDGHRTPCPGTEKGPCEHRSGSLGSEVTSVDMKKMTIEINGQLFKLVTPEYLQELEADRKEKEEFKSEEVDPEPEKKAVVQKPRVEIHTAQPNALGKSWCAPCDRFKALQSTKNYIADLKAKGWDVVTIEYPRGVPIPAPVPHFKLSFNGKDSARYQMYDNTGNAQFTGTFFTSVLNSMR